MQIMIRQAAPDDIPALERLISESARVLSRNYYTDRQINSAVANIFGVDTQLIKDGTYYVAEIDGQIAGCGGWSKRKTLYGGDRAKGDAEDSLLNPQMEPARIRAFFVHPNWARRGIGKRIIEVCERAAAERRFNVAELVATLPGEPLYRACGYEVVERFEIDLPEGLKLPVAKMRRALVTVDVTAQCT
jgi:N-acetylglutamate synthase-like GNAT family acetyltransferase